MHHLPPSACVCTTLQRATRALTRAYDEALAPHGLTIQQFAILRHIRDAQPCARLVPLSRLAQRLVMERTSLYRALPPLERAGLVVLESASARSRSARITARGEALIAAAQPAWEALQDRILTTMTPEAWQSMRAGADRLARLGSPQDDRS